MEHINTIETAKRLIKKEFKFLEEKGYKASFKIITGDTFIEYLSADYQNIDLKRRVNIGYTKGAVYEDIKYTFSASITRVKYYDVKDYFSLDEYLDSIGENFGKSMVSHFDETEATDILEKLSGALKYHAADIIDGTKWLDDFWPRW